MESCDVLIVGGGPAGSSCAWRLRASGLNVVILDKSQFPRHKVCAGWITPPVLDELQIDVADYQQHGVIQPITQFLTGMIGGREVETRYGQTVSYGIRRFEFDNYLLRRSGARLRLGEPFRTIREDAAGWIVNDEIKARIVIGAGGHFCPVARQYSTSSKASGAPPSNTGQAGRRSESELPVVVAQEVEFEMTAAQTEHCTVLPDRPELLFCPDLAGYGWIFRKGNWLNIGLGREHEAHLSAHVTSFLTAMQSLGKLPPDIPGPFHGHAYKLRTSLPKPPTPDGVLLIGDAAGLADRQSGEGIRPAIESGLLAAAAIQEVIASAPSRLNAVYQTQLERRFESSSALSKTSALIPTAARQQAAKWLMSSKWFSRHVLLNHWFLHQEVPMLNV